VKVNEATRRKLIKSFKMWLKMLNKVIKSLIKDMEKAKTVEEIMELKKELLIKYVQLMPITSSYCYFCIEHFMNCDKCEYAKHHGICDYAESDYFKIYDKAVDLKRTIEELYYKGERYD